MFVCLSMRIEGKSIPPTTIPADIGIQDILSQILKKNMQRGVNFNLLIVSEKGTGARTLVSSIYDLDSFPPSQNRISDSLTEHPITLHSNGLSLRLTFYLYRGKSSQEIKDFLISKNKYYHKKNTGINREREDDQRIHSALLLISPLSFRPEDREMFHALSSLCTTFPVITKRDVFTVSELQVYKEKICSQIDVGKSIFFPFPAGCPSLPFSTIASYTTVTSENGVSVRGREYRWGILNAEDTEISDLPFLTQILILNCFMDLKKTTSIHYRNWKESIPAEENSIPLLDPQEKELLKEIEQTIAQRLSEKLAALEADERMLDKAVSSLCATDSNE